MGFTAPTERNSYRYYYNNFDTGFGSPDFQTSLLETALRQPFTKSGSSGRVYYAITTQAPEHVPIGVDHCTQEAGFHVIQGSW